MYQHTNYKKAVTNLYPNGCVILKASIEKVWKQPNAYYINDYSQESDYGFVPRTVFDFFEIHNVFCVSMLFKAFEFLLAV